MEHFALEMLHDNADIAARAVYCRGTGGNMHPRPVRLRLCAATFFRFQAGLVSQNAAFAPRRSGPFSISRDNSLYFFRGRIDLPAPGHGKFSGIHVAGDDRSGSHQRMLAQFHGSNQSGIAADETPRADNGAVLAGSVVVAGNGARSDVHARPYFRIAEVAEMAGLGASAQTGFLHLDKIAHVRVFLQHRSGTEPGIRPHQTAGLHPGAFDVAEGMDTAVLADDGVAEYAMGGDDRSASDYAPPRYFTGTGKFRAVSISARGLTGCFPARAG